MKQKAITHQQAQRKRRNLPKRNTLQRQRRARRGQVRTLIFLTRRVGVGRVFCLGGEKKKKIVLLSENSHKNT